MVKFAGTSGEWHFVRSQPLGAPGGFGAVFRGSGADGTPVAIKVVPPISGSRGDALRRRETAILSKTNQAGSARLIPMLDVGMIGDELCIVLELADGCLHVPVGGVSVDDAL